MRFAIMESIVGSGGHEVEWDKQIVEELQEQGHQVAFYLPQGYALKYDYKVPINYLPGEGVTYAGISGLKKSWLSIKREINRLKWYKELYKQALQGKFDVIIFPTATFRFLRSLNQSILRESPVPVIFCVLGVTPEEAPAFFSEAKKLVKYTNIKIVVISLVDHVLGQKLPNTYCIKPPIFKVRDFEAPTTIEKRETIKIGFFGQYRKEKRMEDCLEAFLNCCFNQNVELIVQTVAIKPEDIAALANIRMKYKEDARITFFDRAVYGKEWYDVINNLDALVIPYATTRFRYHGSGMLLTAIGLYKPMIIADEVWPELFEDYKIGVTYKTGDVTALTQAMELFVETYSEKNTYFLDELIRVNNDLSPQQFVNNLISVAQASK